VRRLLVVLALLALPLQGWRAVEMSRSSRSFLSGVAVHRAGDYAAALTCFERARTPRVADARAWAWSGDAAVLAYDTAAGAQVEGPTGEALLRRAWAGYGGAVLRCPADSWSWSGLAEVSLRRAERDSAEPIDLQVLARWRALHLDPQRAAALAAASLAVELKPAGFQELDALGQVHESLGNVERAHGAYVQSARIMPAPSFHVWGAGRKLAQPLYRAVMEGLEEGVAAAPRFSRSMLEWEIGNFAMDQDDPAEALVHFQAAGREAGAIHEIYHASSDGGRALERLGRHEEALSAYRKALEIHLVPEEDAMRVASLEVKMGRLKDACGDLLLAVRAAPHEEDRRMWAGTVCEQAGEDRVAERVLREGIISPLQSPRLARALLDVQKRTGRANVARGTLESWVRRHPESAELQRWLEELPPPQAVAP
jgi:tetratricopeptide (TPR) repeat protein